MSVPDVRPVHIRDFPSRPGRPGPFARTASSHQRVAVLLDGPVEGWAPPSTCSAVVGRLDPRRRRAFATPLVVRLVDGRVVAVR